MIFVDTNNKSKSQHMELCQTQKLFHGEAMFPLLIDKRIGSFLAHYKSSGFFKLIILGCVQMHTVHNLYLGSTSVGPVVLGRQENMIEA